MANRKLQDAMPLAPLKIVAMGGCSEIGKRVNEIIIARRKEALAASNKPDFMTSDYSIDNYLVDFECLRFGTGEGRAVVNDRSEEAICSLYRILSTIMRRMICMAIRRICHPMIILWI